MGAALALGSRLELFLQMEHSAGKNYAPPPGELHWWSTHSAGSFGIGVFP